MSPLLAPWSSFYVMAGSSAAALTGLMFVVISLVMGNSRLRRAPGGIAAFSTPTVMHFCSALLFSAVIIAPWRALVAATGIIAITALCGAIYILRVALLARRLSTYVPDREDWTWYTILPFAAYLVSFGGAVALPLASRGALFAIAAGTMLLIFIGIRNAWDIVTYIAIGSGDDDPPNG